MQSVSQTRAQIQTRTQELIYTLMTRVRISMIKLCLCAHFLSFIGCQALDGSKSAPYSDVRESRSLYSIAIQDEEPEEESEAEPAEALSKNFEKRPPPSPSASPLAPAYQTLSSSAPPTGARDEYSNAVDMRQPNRADSDDDALPTLTLQPADDLLKDPVQIPQSKRTGKSSSSLERLAAEEPLEGDQAPARKRHQYEVRERYHRLRARSTQRGLKPKSKPLPRGQRELNISRAQLTDDDPSQRMRHRSARSRRDRHTAHTRDSSRAASLERYLSQGAPSSFWPRQGYFENTYLGGDLSYQQELKTTSRRFQRLMRKREHHAWTPPLDPPREGGIGLSARLSHARFEDPQRVVLQVALKGSERFGWRRPTLNMLIAIDPEMLDQSGVEARHTGLVDLVLPALKHLNAADQVGVVFGDIVISPRAPEELKLALIKPLQNIDQRSLSREEWVRVFKTGAQSLDQTSNDPHRAPGAQVMLLICSEGCQRHHEVLKMAAHRMNMGGTLTSVIDHSRSASRRRETSNLWRIAAAGHGGYWIVRRSPEGVAAAMDKEFQRFSRVVARLLRLSVKLSEHVELIEVLGSTMLNQHQTQRVKAREVAMDKRLSARMGIKSDRGEDDEGVQVVIPAFYGGDSHLIHLVFWVRAPGKLAEINLKYKDMVRAQNASAATSVTLSARHAPLTSAHHEVRQGALYHLAAARSMRALDHPSVSSSLPDDLNLWRDLPRLNLRERRLLARSSLGRSLR